MFARVATVFTVLFFVMFAAASAVPRNDNPPPTTQCNTGTVECCNSTQDASNPLVQLLAGLLGLVLGPITGTVGLTCTPIDVVGAGGNSCSSQTVCCTGNNFGGGAIVAGCSPININV